MLESSRDAGASFYNIQITLPFDVDVSGGEVVESPELHTLQHTTYT